LIFLRNDSDCKDVDVYNTRKRYTVIESSDLMRNTFWLASCFSKIKKPEKHCSGNQSVITGVCIFDTIAAFLREVFIDSNNNELAGGVTLIRRTIVPC
jgi:hypothetical protein